MPPGLIVAVAGVCINATSAMDFSAKVYPVAVAPDAKTIALTLSLATVPALVPALSVPSAKPTGWTSCTV